MGAAFLCWWLILHHSRKVLGPCGSFLLISQSPSGCSRLTPCFWGFCRWLLCILFLIHLPSVRDCSPTASVAQEGFSVPTWPRTHHLRRYISLFLLDTKDCQFSDFRFHPSVSPKIGLEVREDAAPLSVRASMGAGLTMAADRHSVWTLSSLPASWHGACFLAVCYLGLLLPLSHPYSSSHSFLFKPAMK